MHKAQKAPPLADIWGDTVDLRAVAVAIVIGVTLGAGAFIGSNAFFNSWLAGTEPGLIKAYSLLVGILGCLLSAIICANIFKPKRSVNQESFSMEDRVRVLHELQIDRVREAEELKTVPPAIVEEMRQLQLYELFADAGSERGKEDK